MTLFKNCILPIENERAMEILSWISELWEENSWTRTAHGKDIVVRTYHEKLSEKLLDSIVELAISNPEFFESLRAEECTLCTLIHAVEDYTA